MLAKAFIKTPQIGLVICAGITSLILGVLFSLIWFGQTASVLACFSDPYIWHITFFSLKQAILSTLFSLLGAIPVSLALYRRRFHGRIWLLRLCMMTFVLPVLVAVFGIVTIYGNSGLLKQLFEWDHFSIYGLSGILIAHVFFNLPLCIRILTQALSAIPQTQHRMACHLGMNALNRFQYIEWPVIRIQLLSISSLVFLLCFTSFAIVMTLGGGPGATTIELAIYQAIHYDFDLALGATLGIWQIVLTGIFSLLFQRMTKKEENGYGVLFQESPPVFTSSIWLNIWDYFWILFSVLFLLPPLVAVVFSGLNADFLKVITDRSLWMALYHSFLIAISSGLLALFFGIGVLLTSRIHRLKREKLKADALEFNAMLILVTPGVVLSTGLFLLFNQFTYTFDYSLVLVIVINTLMALPYVIKSLSVPFYSIAETFEPLCISLGMNGIRRLYLIEWRALKQPIRRTFSLAFILSLGDLSAIALFGSPDFQTLPLYLYRQLGSYQMHAAAVTALILFLLSLGVFIFTENQKITENQNVRC